LPPRAGAIRILVIGGSQARLNSMPSAVPRWRASPWPSKCGTRPASAGSRSAPADYATAGRAPEVQTLHRRHGGPYGWADLVICRPVPCVSELAAAGVGALLVPFPAAVDDHQTRNAQYLVSEGRHC